MPRRLIHWGFTILLAVGIPEPAAGQFLVDLSVSPMVFEPWDNISLDVAVEGPAYCEAETWQGVDVYGTNGFYSWWYSNYPRWYWFTDTLTRRPEQAIIYSALGFSSSPCDEYSGWDTEWAHTAAPRPFTARVVGEGYTGPPGLCALYGGTSPWYYARYYWVQDQWYHDYLYWTHVSEAFEPVVASCGPQNPLAGDTSNGSFTDNFALCAIAACAPGGPGCTNETYQGLFADGMLMRITYLTYTCQAFSVADLWVP